MRRGLGNLRAMGQEGGRTYHPATNLARLWQQHGKRQEAYSLLSEIYGWFTEGFDTKDLQEAKVLLQELAPDVNERAGE